MIIKANKNKEMQQKHKILASLIANSKQIYTTNGTIPVSKSSSFRNTGKVSGVAIMGQMASNKYGSFAILHPAPVRVYSYLTTRFVIKVP